MFGPGDPKTGHDGGSDSDGDTASDSANRVLGQNNFTSTSNNNGASGNNASASSLSGPKGVFFDGTKLYIADTNNNRVLIWNTNPSSNNQSADVVIGQADKTANSSNRGGDTANNTLSNPTTVFVNSSKLFIADTGNHRVLIYDSIPTADGATADRVMGHANFTENEANRLDASTAGIRADTLSEPTDVYYDGSKVVIADSGNHRVLIFDSITGNHSQAADVVIGQVNKTEAKLRSPAANTLNAPNGVLISENGRLLISDSGNNRVLIFNSVPTSDNENASKVIGQTSLTASGSGTSSSRLSNPQDIHSDGDSKLMIADRGNHRVLIYDSIPGTDGAIAQTVLGQANFTSSAANRGEDPDSDSLNGPMGVFTNGTIFWVSDTLNNRALRFPID